MRRVLWLIPIVGLFAVVSCENEPESISLEDMQPVVRGDPASTSFDPSVCGTISGRVTWAGERPSTPPFLFGVPAGNGNFISKMIPNPNAPAIDDKSRAVVGAVVHLRGIDPTRAKPWDHRDHPPVRVEMKDRSILVIQGDFSGRSGFVRRGDDVELKSAEPVFHILRARGTAFFSLTFPQPDQPLSRTFDTAGRVELSSGAGFYWANANLFVCEHPYWTRTGPDGRYRFESVPPGSFEVVAWLPNWNVIKQERDPETGLVFRQTYGAPLESSHGAQLDAKGSSAIDIVLK